MPLLATPGVLLWDVPERAGHGTNSRMDRPLPDVEALLPTVGTAAVWITGFAAGSAPRLVELASTLLTPGERSRAERMRLAEARCEFILGRAILRTLLAERLGCTAATVPLEAIPQHKPRLVGGPVPIQFNLSHAGGRIALAMTLGVVVGVDIEMIDHEVEFLEIAGSHFASAERGALLRTRGEERANCFFRLWTRKEALVKAAGDGLTLPLDGFDVSPALPEELALTIDSLESGPGVWHVRDLEVDGPFAAALAVSQPHLAVSQMMLDEQQALALLQAAAAAQGQLVA